ncbi:MAG TPA: 2-C-methyl-D-erythritol 4-phosphate cytidylyltransferase [Gemmatimonadaceae bacterium]|nr:2-C-methyl-D-erythritol 4-phosphate cytidylyltransferase [Gemmatimonadaceae bacterium]
MANVGVVIVAGGSGTRVGGRELKQFRWVAGKPMLLHSVQTFMARADVVSVVCVLPAALAGDPPPWLFQCDVDRLMISIGGKTRQQSVANGLDDLPDEADIVLVHDAARPGVTAGMIGRVIDAVRKDGAAIAALPVADTLKSVGENGAITGTVDRSALWRAQTPQGFRRDIILRAHREAATAKVDATDDAALCERLGIPVTAVRGDERAMKITDESDFARAAALIGMVDEG